MQPMYAALDWFDNADWMDILEKVDPYLGILIIIVCVGFLVYVMRKRV